MLSFEHTNVMSLVGVCIDGELPLLIMPFMSKGCVLEFVKKHKEELLCIKVAEPQVESLSFMCGLLLVETLCNMILDPISHKESVEHLPSNYKRNGVSCTAQICSSRPGSKKLHVRDSFKE